MNVDHQSLCDQFFPVTFHTPVVAISQCLNFDACRYSGDKINDPASAIVANASKVVTMCPELMMGMSVPRETLRIISDKDGNESLVAPKTGIDWSKPMQNVIDQFLDSSHSLDGIILKGRSPSCGPSDVKRYYKIDEGHVKHKGAGLFAAAIKTSLSPRLPIEEEGRLRSLDIRSHFLTRLFISAEFREVLNSRKMGRLVAFHAKHKLLMLSYNQSRMRALGSLVANLSKRPKKDVFMDYAEQLPLVFRKPSKKSNNLNVLQHSLGYFKRTSGPEEKQFFLSTLEEYMKGSIPLMVPVNIIKSWIVRDKVSYLAQQSFFTPFPSGLPGTLDSTKRK